MTTSKAFYRSSLFVYLIYIPSAIFTYAISDGQHHAERDLTIFPPPNPSIRALFESNDGHRPTYPTLDVAGPAPRRRWMQAYWRAKVQC